MEPVKHLSSVEARKKALSLFEEFKQFAFKGNVIDLAVGVIIGAAFGKIVDSLVNDLIMPVIGKFTGGLDFTQHFIVLTPVPAGVPQTLDALKKAGVAVLAYGNFINVLMNFVILAFVVFMIVKQVNRFRRDKPIGAPPEDVLLLREIRDSLAKK